MLDHTGEHSTEPDTVPAVSQSQQQLRWNADRETHKTLVASSKEMQTGTDRA